MCHAHADIQTEVRVIIIGISVWKVVIDEKW
jgi:hypothetical protein